MAQAQPIPIYAETETFYAPTFEIKVAGNPLPRGVVRDVMSVSYEDAIDQIDSFTLVVNNWDGDNLAPKYVGLEKEPPSGSKEAQIASLFEPGKELELYMGYQGQTPNLRLMMTGFITTLEVDFSQTGELTLTVRGLNILDTFRRKQYTWPWWGKRDSEIAQELSKAADDKLGRPGLGIEVRIDKEKIQSEPVNDYVLMNNQYPIVFLLERARRNGYSMQVMEEGQGKAKQRYLYFGSTAPMLRDVTYELEWGKSLINFRPSLTTTNQISQVTVHGWNRRTNKPIVETAKLGDPGLKLNSDLHAVARQANRQEVITDRPVHTVAQAKALARSILANQLQEIVRADGSTVGLPDLRAGRAVIIKKVGYRFNGHYFVTKTTHTINDTGYRTTFNARREETKKT